MKILIVDDDPKFRRYIRLGLEEQGIECAEAESAEDGDAVLGAQGAHFDVMLLDVMMAGRSGWELLAAMRERGDATPVIFLTARHEVSERVKGLSLGADDYILKPFDFSELMARIQAVLRRRRAMPVIEVGDLRMDLGRRFVERAGERIEMSPREFDFLLALAQRPGETLTRAELLRQIWNIDFDPGTNVVDVLVARLRRRLDRHGPRLIETVVSKGYRLSLPSASGS